MIAEGWNKTLAPQLDRLVQRQLDGALRTNLLPNISRLEVTEFKFGNKSPRIQYIRLLNSSSVYNCGYGLVRGLNPLNLGLNSKKLVLLELGLGFKSEGSLMKASFEHASKSVMSFIPLPRKRLPALISISDLAVQATVVVLIELLPNSPYIQVCRWCFSEKPDVTFSLRPLASLDVTTLPLISQAVEFIINRSFASVVNPKFVEIHPL